MEGDARAALAAVLAQPGGRDALRELLTSEDVVAAVAATQYVFAYSAGSTGISRSAAFVRDEYVRFAEVGLSAAVDALPSGRDPADRGAGDDGQAGKRASDA